MAEKFILYDLAWRHEPNKCWSYNVWKARLALNFMDVPCTTQWVNHNTLESTLASLGVEPNAQGFVYTVPTMQFPNGSVIMGSNDIVTRLESLYAAKSLHQDQELQAEADQAIFMATMPLAAIFVPRIAKDIVEPSTVSAFKASRVKGFGITFEQIEQAPGGEQAWEAAGNGFALMKNLLTQRKTSKGPFILGEQVCYADFILLAFFAALKKLGNGMFERAVGYDESFKRLYTASESWLRNDK